MNLVPERDPWLIVVELSCADEICLPGIQLLNGLEKDRAKRYLRANDQRSFIAAHTLKRLVLAVATDTEPQLLQFRTNEFGKPELTGGDVISFNISHTQGMVAIACSRTGAIGVDVECLKDLALDMLWMKQVFTDDEVQAIRNAPDSIRVLLRFWTAKEAVMKADGKGMSLPINEIKIADKFAISPGALWQLRQYYPSPSHVLTLACKGSSGLTPEKAPVLCFSLAEDALWRWAEHDLFPKRWTVVNELS